MLGILAILAASSCCNNSCCRPRCCCCCCSSSELPTFVPARGTGTFEGPLVFPVDAGVAINLPFAFSDLKNMDEDYNAFIIERAGTYRICYAVEAALDTAAEVSAFIQLTRNGVVTNHAIEEVSPSASDCESIVLAAGDEVRLALETAAGGMLAVENAMMTVKRMA